MNKLNITTFNIRCFGFNGDYFAKNLSESRIQYIKKLLNQNFSQTDVFVLQEIMDLTILDQILPKGFKFYSYSHDYPRHMHIALCCKENLDFNDLKTIPDTAIDDKTSRPAFYGQLIQAEKPLAHIVGVHLKSDYNNTNNRIRQSQAICTFLKDLPQLPTIVTGDFNSHKLDKTKKNKDDIFYINEVFKEIKLTRAIQDEPTYITTFEQAYLDHIWCNTTVTDISVYDYLQYSELNPIKTYFDQISDHLPVSASISLS